MLDSVYPGLSGMAANEKGDKQMKIFISYRRVEDNRSNIVYIIHNKLSAVFGKENIFRDTRDITPGTEWEGRLEQEVNSCKVMLVVIGPDWTTLQDNMGNKRLFKEKDVTRWEVETGLNRRREEGISVIPVMVGGAKSLAREDLPETLHDLTKLQGLSLRSDSDLDIDLDKLIQVIRKLRGFREDDIKVKEEYEPQTIYIEAGPFWMGSQPGEGIPPFEEGPHHIDLPSFRIGKYPVTNKQFAVFIQKTGRDYVKIGWKSLKIPQVRENFPVTKVNWYDARDYCLWLSKVTGRLYSLPNEAQWEKACRGGNTTFYPWGNEFDPARCNQGQGHVEAVDKYLEQNDYGCFDLVGNIRQWTCSLWGTIDDAPNPAPAYRYPWKDDGRDNLDASSRFWRVVRGSSYGDERSMMRCSYRCGDVLETRGYPGSPYGFRVAMATE